MNRFGLSYVSTSHRCCRGYRVPPPEKPEKKSYRQVGFVQLQQAEKGQMTDERDGLRSSFEVMDLMESSSSTIHYLWKKKGEWLMSALLLRAPQRKGNKEVKETKG